MCMQEYMQGVGRGVEGIGRGVHGVYMQDIQGVCRSYAEACNYGNDRENLLSSVGL